MTDLFAAEPATDPDAVFRNFMRHNLQHAAAHFGLTVIERPAFGWRLRSISTTATGHGGKRWLRVVSQEPQWAQGESWTGTFDANAITGIAKPRVLDIYEWSEQNWRNQRAEVMTLIPGNVCSATDLLRTPVDFLPDQWWADLHHYLAVLADVDTRRTYADQDKISDRIHQRFGNDVDTAVHEWETVHGDLHWNNLHCPDFALVDWESWGRGPAGLDAATLLCFSLCTPEVARRVRSAFAAKLDSSTGRVAQLYVVARLFRRIDGGDFRDLKEPLEDHVRRHLLP